MAKTFKQFRLDNVTATLPTTLEYGEEVYYTDSNGNLTLWVGHSDGSAWPVCGYKELSGTLTQSGTSAPTCDVFCNNIGPFTLQRTNVGEYTITFSESVTLSTTNTLFNGPFNDLGEQLYSFFWTGPSGTNVQSFRTLDISQYPLNPEADSYLLNTPFWIRIYP